MYYILVGILTVLGVLMTVLILLHSGKGGVSGIFGGGMAETPFGGTSVIEKNLTRATVVVAVLFFIVVGLLVFVVEPPSAQEAAPAASAFLNRV